MWAAVRRLLKQEQIELTKCVVDAEAGRLRVVREGGDEDTGHLRLVARAVRQLFDRVSESVPIVDRAAVVLVAALELFCLSSNFYVYGLCPKRYIVYAKAYYVV